MFLVVFFLFSSFPFFPFFIPSLFSPFFYSCFLLLSFPSFTFEASPDTVLLGLNSPQLKIRSTTSGRACIIQIFIQLKTREEIWQQVQEELQGIVKTGSLVVMLTVRQAGTE